MGKYILSIDQGTTGTTVSLMTVRGQIKVKVNKEFRQIFPKPGWVEHDPKDIWGSVLKAIRAALAKGKVSAHDILTIGITNQRETLVAWDRKTGEPIGNAIVWQCRRTTDFCSRLKKRGLEKLYKKKTGLVLDPYFSGTKMHWILNNNSEAKRLAKRGELCFGTIDSFLVWKLSGGQVFATDVSNASRTLCMDLDTLCFDSQLAKPFGVKLEMLPEIRSSAGDFGTTLKVRGLPDGIPVSGVIGDQQSALFGQKCFAKGQAKITFGTGSFLLMNTGQTKVLSKKGLLTTVGWKLPRDRSATYALEGGAFVCGAAVQWLRDSMGFIKKSEGVEALAQEVQDCGGVQFVPAFAGLGAPHWDPNVRGTLLGMTRGTAPAHIARATLEAMALQNVDIVEAMKSESRSRMTSVRVDGGAVHNPLLMQMQADFLGVKVLRPKTVETTTLGAALMAGVGVGVWKGLKDIQKLDKIDREFLPKISSSERRKRLKLWHQAVNGLKTLYSKSI